MERLLSAFNPIILASRSPRRREILSNLGLSYETYERVSTINNSLNLQPSEFVITQAEMKAKEPVSRFKNGLIITADTIVYSHGQILEKPIDHEDAERMISMLQGTTHQVYTGLCLSDCASGLSMSDAGVTDVMFSNMTHEEIEWYVNTKEYCDKAGGYAIQGLASQFIQGINGCYFNVVGFPVNTFYQLLKALNSDREIDS